MKDAKFGNYFKLPNPGLKAYFHRVVKGDDDEIRTPFSEGKSVTQVIKDWIPTLSHLNSDKKFHSLFEYELELAEKAGPMSVMFPLKKRLADIDHYYEDILLSSEPIDKSAMDAVLYEWRQAGKFYPKSQYNTIDKMKLNTNSGAPFFTKRKGVLDKTYPCSSKVRGKEVEISLDNIDELTTVGNLWETCAILGWRGQEGGPSKKDVKQRVVWMFPFSVNIEELTVYQPLISAAQEHNLVPAWNSLEAVDLRMTRLFDTKSPEDYVICTDFSKFDQHFNQDMQKAAYYILEHLLMNCQMSRNWLRDVFPIKYMIPLAYDYGKIRFGKHGMASGSGGTNADETLVHRALQYEAAFSKGKNLNPNSQCLGDDGVISFPGITVEDVVQSYSRHGQEMNPDKQYVSKHNAIYLRKWYSDQYRVEGICRGVYSTTRALCHLCEQERFYDEWSKEMVCLRYLSIIENCKWHPLREEFLSFCIARDKYRLGLDIPGFLDNIERKAKEAAAKIPDMMGYVRSLSTDGDDAIEGISNWWVVKSLLNRRRENQHSKV